MGSVGAMNKGSADRYFQKKQKINQNMFLKGLKALLNIKEMLKKHYINLLVDLDHQWAI